jgi:hypothetical protein
LVNLSPPLARTKPPHPQVAPPCARTASATHTHTLSLPTVCAHGFEPTHPQVAPMCARSASNPHTPGSLARGTLTRPSPPASSAWAAPRGCPPACSWGTMGWAGPRASTARGRDAQAGGTHRRDLMTPPLLSGTEFSRIGPQLAARQPPAAARATGRPAGPLTRGGVGAAAGAAGAWTFGAEAFWQQRGLSLHGRVAVCGGWLAGQSNFSGFNLNRKNACRAAASLQ